MIKKIVLSLITVLSFCSLALAQNKQVTGTVTDEKGEPIIGATVVAEGTSAGTTTGGDGQFTLTVPANATLSISFIGYETQKVSVAGKTHIDVTLGEEATGIEDVVVIGYGTGKKIGSVIGSVDQVKSEKIENRPSTNVVDALQGQVAGLQIMTGNGELTSTSSIRIHGLGSMGADTSPLILLDGAPIQASTLQTINQNDIASVNVLKDASATSIYGSRAANGVIYVQTKTGRRNQESVDVTLTGQYSMSSAVAPELNMMSANEMLDYIGAAVAVRLSGDALTTPDKIASGRQYFIRNFGLAKFMDENYNPMNDYKWWNEILERNAPMYQVDLSVSGGSAKTSYYFSGNYANKTGILPGSELDRYNFRTNIDTRANNWLRLGLNLGLGYQHSSVADTNESQGGLYVSNPVMASLITPPYQPLYDDNGQMLNFFDATQAINPLMTADYMPRWQNRITMNGMAFIELTPVKGLTIRSSLAVDAFDWRSHGASSPETPTPSGKFGTGSASELFQRFYEWTWTNTAEYKHTWNEVHNFTALLGEETLYRNNNSFSVASIGITSSRFLNIATTIGMLFMGVMVVKYGDSLMPGRLTELLPHGAVLALSLLATLACAGVVLFQLATVRLAGAVTLSQPFISQIVLLKRTYFALAVIVTSPVLLLFALCPRGTGGVWFCIIVIELIVTAILYLREVLNLFISKKVSILHWILYLCIVEVFPVSLLWLLVAR